MAGALLDYSVATAPFPVEADALVTIRVLASNPSPDPSRNPVTIAALEVNVPIGDGGSALTASATGIVPVPPRGWNLLSNTRPGVYVFQPPAPVKVGEETLVLELQQVRVNHEPGDVHDFAVTEGSNGCRPPHCPTQRLPLTKFPPGWGKVDFSADPPDVELGQDVTLSWQGPAGATYRIDYVAAGRVVTVPAPGDPPLASSGVYPGADGPPLAPARTTVFTLEVTAVDGADRYSAQVQRSVTVQVSPSISSFTGTVAERRGRYEARFEWLAENADYCTLGDDAAELAPQAKRDVALEWPFIRSYQLRAVNRDSPDVDSRSLTPRWGVVGTHPVEAHPRTPVVSADGAALYVIASAAGAPAILGFAIRGSELQPVGQWPCGGLESGAAAGAAGTLWLGVYDAANTYLRAVRSQLTASGWVTTQTGPSVSFGAGRYTTSALAAAPGGSRLFVSDGGGFVRGFPVGDWDKECWAQLETVYAMSATATVVYCSTEYPGTGGVHTLDARTCRTIGFKELPAPPTALAALGGFVASAEGERIVLRDGTSLEPVGAPIDYAASGLAVAPNGCLYATGASKDEIAILAPAALVP